MDTSYRGAMKIYKRHRNPATPLLHRGLHLVLGRGGEERGGEGRRVEWRGGEGRWVKGITHIITNDIPTKLITVQSLYAPTISDRFFYLCAWNADTAGMNCHNYVHNNVYICTPVP